MIIFFCFLLTFLTNGRDISVESCDKLALRFSPNGDITEMDIEGKNVSSNVVGGFSFRIYGEGHRENPENLGDDILGDWGKEPLDVYGINNTETTPSRSLVYLPYNMSMIQISGESKPNFPGNLYGRDNPSYDYCIFYDIIYTDQSALYNQFVTFPPTASDFVYRSDIIRLTKPILRLTITLRVRGVFAYEGFYATFRNVSVRPYYPSPLENGTAETVSDNEHVRVTKSVHDLAIVSDFVALDNHISINGTITNTNTDIKSRTLTLILAFPLDANTPVNEDGSVSGSYAGWAWGSGDNVIPLEPPVSTSPPYSTQSLSTRNLNGRLVDFYTVVGISNDTTGLGLGVPLDKILVWRFVYNPLTKMLMVEIDLMVGEYNEVPNIASFSVTLYKLNNPSRKWPWRAAWQKYSRVVFADIFQTNVILDQGVWQCQGTTSTIPGWEDFGIKFYEGDWESKWTVEHGIYLFPYIEPNLIFLNSKTLFLNFSKPTVPQLATMCVNDSKFCKIIQTSHMIHANGNVQASRDGSDYAYKFVVNAGTKLEPVEFNQATDQMNLIDVRYEYAEKWGGEPHGIYLDSVEASQTWWDYRTETFKYSIFSPTFDNNRRGFLPWYAGSVDFVRELKKNMLNDRPRKPSYIMANTVLYGGNPHMAVGVDVFGMEVSSWYDGVWHGGCGGGGLHRRSLADQKPLVNLDYSDLTDWTHNFTEMKFEGCLLDGVWPSYNWFAYYNNSERIERDRDLFKHFIPLYRAVTSKGWEAVPCATLHNASSPDPDAAAISLSTFRIERWGHVSPFMFTMSIGASSWGADHSVLLDFDEACLLSTPMVPYRYPRGSNSMMPTHMHSIVVRDRTQGVRPEDGEGIVLGQEWADIKIGPDVTRSHTYVLEVTLTPLDNGSSNGDGDSDKNNYGDCRSVGDKNNKGGKKTFTNFVFIITVVTGVMVVAAAVVIIGCVIYRRRRRRGKEETKGNNDEFTSSSLNAFDHVLRARQTELDAQTNNLYNNNRYNNIYNNNNSYNNNNRCNNNN